MGIPLVRAAAPPPAVQRRLTNEVTTSGDALSVAIRGAREAVRESAREDTRDTTIFVVAGLAGALLAALILFSGLINSMRAPLGRLVDGARRLAGGELDTRVEVGGPVEIATLGQAFNEMATSLERDAAERDRVEQMKDDFVLTVSHELRTPVTVVKGFAEMLTAERKALSAPPVRGGDGDRRERRPASEDDQRPARPRPQRRGEAAHRPRADGRARPRSAGRPADAPELRGAGTRSSRSASRRDLPEVEADADRIGQVLANLLTNANKYAQEGAKVRLTASRAGDDVEFEVSDDGPGLGQEELDHVFERFWRAQSGETQAVGGTGLGLAIAKSLVDLHGGAISAESDPGQGRYLHVRAPDRQARKLAAKQRPHADDRRQPSSDDAAGRRRLRDGAADAAAPPRDGRLRGRDGHRRPGGDSRRSSRAPTPT